MVTVPTVSSIKLRFPEFADVADSLVGFAIEEASLSVSDSWKTKANLALVYLTAHYVACSDAAASGTTSDGIASESIGRISITYTQAAQSAASADDLSSTWYGRRYEQLRDLNFGGPLVVL